MTREMARQIATTPANRFPELTNIGIPTDRAELQATINATGALLAVIFCELTDHLPKGILASNPPIDFYPQAAQTVFRAAMYIHGFDITQIGHRKES